MTSLIEILEEHEIDFKAAGEHSQALLHCIENVTVTIRVKGPDNEHSGETLRSTDD